VRALVLVLALAAQSGSLRVMGTVGCLVEEEGKWFLTDATEPVPGDDVDRNLDPAAKGELRFAVIGTVSEFSVPDHAGHKVRLKGLILDAEPVDRLQLTSLKHVAPSCP
jgi:hypothetical protein